MPDSSVGLEQQARSKIGKNAVYSIILLVASALIGLAALESDFTQAGQRERELGVKIQQAIER